jgi:hypothetical protein
VAVDWLAINDVFVGDHVTTCAGSAVHWANNVIAEVSGGLYGLVNAEPPEAARNHPEKVYPSRDGAEGNVTEPPVKKLPSATLEPPASSYDTTFDFAVHCAYSVSLILNGYEELLAKLAPEPSEDVFQPAKL